MNKNIYGKGRPAFNLPSFPHMCQISVFTYLGHKQFSKMATIIKILCNKPLYYDVNTPKYTIL